VPGHLNRGRIRDYLAATGPVEDAGGQATAILRDAVSYQGSEVGFSQLLSAMEGRGEITREIRGKRTYRIAARPAESAPSSAEPADQARRARRPSRATPVGAAITGEAASEPAIDYDALAAALLDRVLTIVSSRGPAGQSAEGLLGDLQRVTEERDQLRAQVHEFEDRLTRADRNTAILLRLMSPKPLAESRDDLGSVAAEGHEVVDALLGALMRAEGPGRPGKPAQAS